MRLVVKVKSSLVPGKPPQGCCLAGEGNQEGAVSGERPGEATELTHRLKRQSSLQDLPGEQERH